MQAKARMKARPPESRPAQRKQQAKRSVTEPRANFHPHLQLLSSPTCSPFAIAKVTPMEMSFDPPITGGHIFLVDEPIRRSSTHIETFEPTVGQELVPSKKAFALCSAAGWRSGGIPASSRRPCF